MPKPRTMTRKRPPGYYGVLFIRCPHCGKEGFLRTTAPIREIYCVDCGALINLYSMKRMDIRCEAEHYTFSLTNISDQCFDVPCPKCEYPVTVEYNPKTKKYKSL